MAAFICVTCGTQFPPADAPPDTCPICSDERQYVGPGGQRWTTPDALRATHFNAWRLLEPELFGLGTMPAFAIGQRALLLRTPGGNVLWDCLSLLDDATMEIVAALGGIAAICISHPHYYTAMVDWARAFAAPVWLHAADRQHVVRPDPALRFWSGPCRELWDGITLINAPGHFDGATMLHWPAGAGGRGALLAGDIVQVVPDRRWVGFMRSYPNLIPLPARTVRGIAAAVAPFAFERVYGAFWDREVTEDGRGAVLRSAERHMTWISG
ncbi:MBL fold metallo-hydrolase [Rhodovastum atsumiense]|uniref:MBL fold metallo-hydrolase n=1 Tax=Rhodovastum atsumiense TaxID=504468 RepID=A0A5M6ITG8_9PROT|nr:MBL fold metallo-hydrolase [Rhodovastum atsumiense]KAA5611511.1 MBL fold metallo-hydrolase [Rhodovastum atsumiense]CAH2601210.1 MBL fold metallo-hydrolase [Rhodovastum atsumiense]